VQAPKPRRRFRGKQVLPNGVPRSSNDRALKGKEKDFPRVHCSGGTGGGKPPFYECGQPKPLSTHGGGLGPYKVSLPANRNRVKGVYRTFDGTVRS
jgi:hypothetical protein